MLEQNILSGFADEIDRSFERQLQVLGQIGQKWLDLRSADGIPVAQISKEQARDFKRQAESAGVRVHMLASAIGKIMITDPLEPQLQDLEHLAELADIFETNKIRIFSFYLPEEEVERYRDEVLDRMSKLVEFARSAGLILYHENEKGIYGDTPERCVDLMEHFYGDHFQAIFDFANFVQVGCQTEDAFAQLFRYIGAIHIKDARASDGETVPAGEGDGHIPEILRKLDQAGFAGGLTLEPHLVDFDGFVSLERGTAAQKKKGDGESAYLRAYHALKALQNKA